MTKDFASFLQGILYTSGIAFATYYIWLIHETRRNGVRTTATIIKLSRVTIQGLDYYISFYFMDSDNKVDVYNQWISPKTYDLLLNEETVPVAYLARFPRLSLIGPNYLTNATRNRILFAIFLWTAVLSSFLKSAVV